MQKQKYSNLSELEQQQRRHENAVRYASYFAGLLHAKTNERIFKIGLLPYMKLGELDEIINFCSVTLGVKQFKK